MGEIKSAIELAMEKTKKFALSDKEKEEMKQKEVLQKAGSLFHRYGDGRLSLNEVLKEVKKMEEGTAATVKKSLLSRWIDTLALNDDYEKNFKGIEAFKGQDIDEVKRRFQQLLSQYQEEKEKLKEKTNLELTETLKREGIWGSAVAPKLEGSSPWKKENEKLDRSYTEKLEEIKEELKGLSVRVAT